MKKTLLKILGTILAIVVFIIAQYYIRIYYHIDPRIWFLIVYGISLIGLFLVYAIFYSEIIRMKDYFKTHSFYDFISEIAEKIENITQNIKPIIEKVVNNFLYIIVILVCEVLTIAGVLYNGIFHDDFIERKTIYIIFLVSMGCVLLFCVLRAIVGEKRKRTINILSVVIWTYLFLSHFLEFLRI